MEEDPKAFLQRLQLYLDIDNESRPKPKKKSKKRKLTNSRILNAIEAANTAEDDALLYMSPPEDNESIDSAYTMHSRSTQSRYSDAVRIDSNEFLYVKVGDNMSDNTSWSALQIKDTLYEGRQSYASNSRGSISYSRGSENERPPSESSITRSIPKDRSSVTSSLSSQVEKGSTNISATYSATSIASESSVTQPKTTQPKTTIIKKEVEKEVVKEKDTIAEETQTKKTRTNSPSPRRIISLKDIKRIPELDNVDPHNITRHRSFKLLQAIDDSDNDFRVKSIKSDGAVLEMKKQLAKEEEETSSESSNDSGEFRKDANENAEDNDIFERKKKYRGRRHTYTDGSLKKLTEPLLKNKKHHKRSKIRKVDENAGDEADVEDNVSDNEEDQKESNLKTSFISPAAKTTIQGNPGAEIDAKRRNSISSRIISYRKRKLSTSSGSTNKTKGSKGSKDGTATQPKSDKKSSKSCIIQ